MARAIGTGDRDYPACVVRRAVLFGFTTAGAAALVGCGGPSEDPYAGAADTGGLLPDGTYQPSAPPSSASAVPSSAAPLLVKTADIPVGGAVLAGELLVAQPQRGVFKAYHATCPHQGVTVNPPARGATYVVCPGHTSKFKLVDGSKISGPTPRGLRAVAVKVRNGYVVKA